MKTRRLEFESYDGRAKIGLGHGAKCVLIQVRDKDYGNSGVILTPDEAEAMGRSLIWQARYSLKEPIMTMVPVPEGVQ